MPTDLPSYSQICVWIELAELASAASQRYSHRPSHSSKLGMVLLLMVGCCHGTGRCVNLDCGLLIYMAFNKSNGSVQRPNRRPQLVIDCS